ncbi:MAG: hypothetical protein QGI21_06100 [Candidatus Poseidoniaceae archaeon]|jgi:hypothetical protein|nr:hypothetical protein [Candidatus Poseidoniaceae archaeon]
MSEDVEEIEVRVPHLDVDNKSSIFDWFRLSVLSNIWKQITAGVGVWGTLRPIVAILLALIPFLYLGQHFNRKHQRGFDWFMLQIPLSFTLILWAMLFFWSIFDAWRDASIIVANNSSPDLIGS